MTNISVKIAFGYEYYNRSNILRIKEKWCQFRAQNILIYVMLFMGCTFLHFLSLVVEDINFPKLSLIA